MAEKDTWPLIKQHGLLTSNQIIERSDLEQAQIEVKKHAHRANKETYNVTGIGTVSLRDQVPMAPKRLALALSDGLSPKDWYSLINERVFFWAEEERLNRLLNARLYSKLEHDVLTISTESLLHSHSANIRLSHMNSGNTFPSPHKRGADLFKTIQEYEVKANGNPKKPVVEITVLDGVPDIASHVISVRRMKGSNILEELEV
jgi:hypothetical protein